MQHVFSNVYESISVVVLVDIFIMLRKFDIIL